MLFVLGIYWALSALMLGGYTVLHTILNILPILDTAMQVLIEG